MNEEIYDRLVDALDALPNGFPRTESGVELRILKKAFKPEEAEVANQMSRNFETVGEIARRVGLPPNSVENLLKEMLPTALAGRREVGGAEKYRLGPFIMGWYESYLSRSRDDREFAELLCR